ncbi:MAG: KEOPS complex kinase/ATPase Bud32 [Candidatus Micrarchaeia archaeon]
MKLISEGAEAKIYLCNIWGSNIIAKVRLEKAYREKLLDEKIRSARTKNEARILYRMEHAGVAAPRLVGVGKFSIYMTFIKGALLRDIKKKKEILFEVGKMLAKMHNEDVSHGDFTPANIIVSNGAPYVIDFGLAEITKSMEEKAIDLLLMKRSLATAQYKELETSYLRYAKEGKKIKERLNEIEKRGRYKTRTLQTD